MAEWGLTIEHYDKTVNAFVTTASSVDMTFPLNAPAEVNLSIAHNSQEANAIYTLLATTMPCLRVTRNGTGVFFGVMTSCESTLDEDAVMNLSFTDWVGTWANCYRNNWSDDVVPYNATLLSTGMNGGGNIYMLGNPTGSAAVTTGPFTNNAVTTPVATPYPSLYTYPGKWGTNLSLLDRVNELAASDTYGYEWFCDVDPSTGQCRANVGSTVGSNKSASVVFGHGSDLGNQTISNCTSAQTTFLPPVNYVYIEQNDDGRATEKIDATSVSSYGEWGVLGEPQVNSYAGTYYATGLIRPNPRQAVIVTADPSLAPQPWTDYYLGDTVGVIVKRDKLSVSGNYRVNQIAVALDENMTDVAHQLTFEVK